VHVVGLDEVESRRQEVGVIGLLVTMLIFAPRRSARGVVEERVIDDRPSTY